MRGSDVRKGVRGSDADVGRGVRVSDIRKGVRGSDAGMVLERVM